MRKLTLLCRIVDNLGDAGVALRFARQWLQSHPDDSISICTDQTAPFHRLLGTPSCTQPGATNSGCARISLLQTLDPPADFDWGDIVIEMFGTPVPQHWKEKLAARNPQPRWVNLEYLSAETWVEDCHGLWSTDPSTGWKQLFFFPGFTARTGGLLGEEKANTLPCQTERVSVTPTEHITERSTEQTTEATTEHATVLTPEHAPDYQHDQPVVQQHDSAVLRAFVFAYSLEPLVRWLRYRDKSNVSFHVASASNSNSIINIYSNNNGNGNGNALIHTPTEKFHSVDFVPQKEFDTLLKSFDLLFVRGEDSFVRAQLTGLPFVWQIYPTEDGAHWEKLEAFFSLYAEGLEEPARQRLKNLWWYWNGAKVDEEETEEPNIDPACINPEARAIDILDAALCELDALRAHARQWKSRILAHCNLIERLEQALALNREDTRQGDQTSRP